MDLTPGSTFAGYTVVRRLGRGGMGQVYLVDNPALQRREALKLISTGSGTPADFHERFAREARTAAALHHPGIITVHAYGDEDGTPWFTMRHLDGHDLTQQKLTDTDINGIARQTAAALDYAHSRGVVHRDVKPANIFLTRDHTGHIETVTLLDFGIARLADDAALTGTNQFLGTLNYSAPELIAGQPATPASDQYALACTLYELLTGTPPFTAANPLALLRAHADTPPPPISHHRPDLAALDPAFARALAKDPAHRFPTCTDFITATQHTGIPVAHTGSAAAHTVPASPAQPTVPRQQPAALTPADSARKKRRLLLLGAALTVVVLLAGGITAYVLTRPEPAAATDAGNLIATGSKTTCVVTDGTPSCWGSNGFGQLGDGTTDNRTAPAVVPGLTGVTALTTEGGATCAIADRTAYCWGNNVFGQLGDGTTGNRTTPTPVPGLTDVTDITTSGGTTCAVADAAAYCWGHNDGTTELRTTPTRVPGLSDVTAITTSDGTTCAVADAAAYCWGDNSVGQLGDGAHGNRTAPTRVPGLTGATDITTGLGTTCAIADRIPYCWGYNYYGQLGDGTRTGRTTPTRVPGLTGVTALTTEGATTCAIADRTAYCWGGNLDGQVGDGTTDNRTAPTRVPGLSDVTAITTDGGTTCAVADAVPYCWGDNSGGQLGDGTTDSRTTPVAVRLP